MDNQGLTQCDLVSIAQRVSNLSHVLALDPYHSAARTALKTAVSEAARDAELHEPAEELAGRLDQAIDDQSVQELIAAADRLYEWIVSRTKQPNGGTTEQE